MPAVNKKSKTVIVHGGRGGGKTAKLKAEMAQRIIAERTTLQLAAAGRMHSLLNDLSPLICNSISLAHKTEMYTVLGQYASACKHRQKEFEKLIK